MIEIDRLKAIQRHHGFLETHLVTVEAGRFHIAHTDHERATLPDLTDCDLHRWMTGLDGPPVPPGTYFAEPQEADPVSPWFFTPLGRET